MDKLWGKHFDLAMSCKYSGRQIHIAEGGRVGKKSCKQLPLTKLCERREKKVLKTRQTGKLHSPRASNKRQKNKMIRMLVKSAVKCRVFSRNEASNTSSLAQ